MEPIIAATRPSVQTRVAALIAEFESEIVRKSLHLLIALVPPLAAWNLRVAMLILGAGTLFYVYAEWLRLEGGRIYLISELTVLASRPRDRGRFVLGPVTLGLGAMLALLLYPAPAATIAIYALAFGDGFASLAGKLFGRVRIPFTGGKTIAGSLACFVAVLVSTQYLMGNTGLAFTIAGLAALLEALPSGDFDNLILPVGTGFAATKLLLLT